MLSYNNDLFAVADHVCRKDILRGKAELEMDSHAKSSFLK